MDPVVVVNGKEYPFVTEGDLTLGEAAELERITGQGYDLSKIGALGLLALTFISVRRVDATVTLDDLNGLRGEDIELKVEEAEAVPPTSPDAASASGVSGSEGSLNASDVSLAASPDVSGTPV